MSHPLATIQLVVGNLGARAMIRRTRRQEPASDPLLDALPQLARLGFDAVEDYVCWSQIEPEPGRFDFEMHREHQRVARAAGLEYHVYPWLHSMPRWAFEHPDFVPVKCLEHDRPAPFPSIFAPGTLAALERFYETLHHGLGPVNGLTIALPCDYGEVGYPSGQGCWAMNYPDDLDHCHRGFWCGDLHAVAAFRAAALEKYGDVASVDAAWDTEYGHAERIAPRDPTDPTSNLAYRLDFGEWYKSRLTRFTEMVLDRAASWFPSARLAFKLGFASEEGRLGQDYQALIRLAKDKGASVWSTHGTLPVHFHKRIQTLCRHIGVPYLVEGIAEPERERVLDRLFEEAADGAQSFFEFHNTFEKFTRDFRDRLPFLRGEFPRVDVALLFNSERLARSLELGYPERLHALAPPLREVLDFEIVDEALIHAAGVLSSYGVLGVPDPRPMTDATRQRIHEFAAAGGLVVCCDPDASIDADGIRAAFEFCGVPAPVMNCRFGFGTEWNHLGEILWLEPARAYFADGGDDEPCAWFGGRAGCRFPIDATSDWELEMDLHVPAAAHPEEWRIRVNSCTTGFELRQGPQKLRVPVPAVAVRGGVVELILEGPTFASVDGTRSIGLLLRSATLHRATLRSASSSLAGSMPSGDASVFHAVADPVALADRSLRRVGAGGFLDIPGGDLPLFAAALFAASAHRSSLIDEAVDFPQPDGVRDGVRIATFADRWLVYNRSSVTVTKTLGSRTGPVRLVAGEMRWVNTSNE